MYEKDWKKQQQECYEQNKKQVASIQNCIGNSNHRITFTYLSMFNYRDCKTYIYFMFVPFITEQEKEWEESGTDPWRRSYLFNSYPENPFIYIKDDWMYCSEEFYKIVYNKKCDFEIFRYEDFTLKDAEYVIIAGKTPHLRYVQSSKQTDKDFQTWMKEKTSVCDVALRFANPQEGSLFINPFKEVVLTTHKNKRYRFFDVKIL